MPQCCALIGQLRPMLLSDWLSAEDHGALGAGTCDLGIQQSAEVETGRQQEWASFEPQPVWEVYMNHQDVIRRNTFRITLSYEAAALVIGCKHTGLREAVNVNKTAITTRLSIATLSQPSSHTGDYV